MKSKPLIYLIYFFLTCTYTCTLGTVSSWKSYGGGLWISTPVFTLSLPSPQPLAGPLLLQSPPPYVRLTSNSALSAWVGHQIGLSLSHKPWHFPWEKPDINLRGTLKHQESGTKLLRWLSFNSPQFDYIYGKQHPPLQYYDTKLINFPKEFLPLWSHKYLQFLFLTHWGGWESTALGSCFFLFCWGRDGRFIWNLNTSRRNVYYPIWIIFSYLIIFKDYYLFVIMLQTFWEGRNHFFIFFDQWIRVVSLYDIRDRGLRRICEWMKKPDRRRRVVFRFLFFYKREVRNLQVYGIDWFINWNCIDTLKSCV